MSPIIFTVVPSVPSEKNMKVRMIVISTVISYNALLIRHAQLKRAVICFMILKGPPGLSSEITPCKYVLTLVWVLVLPMDMITQIVLHIKEFVTPRIFTIFLFFLMHLHVPFKCILVMKHFACTGPRCTC